MSHGGAPRGWLEFSANLNPLGVPDAVRAAITAATYERYSDLDVAVAEGQLAADAGVPAECVLLTAGATEAIRLVITALGPLTDQVVVVGPTYDEYARIAMNADRVVCEVRATRPLFTPPIARARAAASEGRSLLFICDPNNPTGRGLGPDGLGALVSSGSGGYTVIDQSFAPFAEWQPKGADLLAAGNVVVIRSLTKRCAIPGVRVGYVIARPDMIERLRALADPWSAGAHAIAVARSARWSLSAHERLTVTAWREELASALVAFGLDPLPSEANFLLVHGGVGAGTLAAQLAARQIAVRACASFGLPEHLRFAVRPPHEQDVLFAALSELRG
jgi:histidinol-phosphate/aromatic aminotransferase/cobyric acid decarboxylase-like protein